MTFTDFFKKYKYLFLLVVLSLVIIYPLKSGFFFLMDNIGHPAQWLAHPSYWHTPLGWIPYNTILPIILTSSISQKLFFCAIIFLFGLGGYRIGKKINPISAWLCGLFAIFNPFVYSRMLDGQIGVLLGIALLLWATVYILEYLRTRTLKNLIISSVFTGIAIGFMSQLIFMAFLVYFVLFVAYFPLVRNSKAELQVDSCLRRNDKERGRNDNEGGRNDNEGGGNDKKESENYNTRISIKKYLFNALLSLIIIFALNANWIISDYFFAGKTGDFIQNTINRSDFLNFSSESGDTSLYFNTLSLHGYWGEAEGRFLPSTFLIDHWQFVFALIFAIILIGIYYSIKNRETRKNGLAFLIIAITSYILAMGIASPHFGFITQWMYDHIPFYKGLREPQKWAGVLLICYLYFSAIGIKYILKWKYIRKAKTWWGIALCLLPVIYTSSMLFGFMGQLKTSDYPKDWYAVNEEFFDNTQAPKTECTAKTAGLSKDCYQTLALPWHQYMGFKFAGKIIANPTKGFFYNTKVLMGDNMEIGNIYSQSSRPESKIIETYVGPGSDRALLSENPFIKSLQSLGIKYVLVAKEADWEGYNKNLNKNPDLHIIWDTDNLVIYAIE